MSRPASLLWFAQHEGRLAWRDWLHMMTAGRRRRVRSLAVGVIVALLLLHGIAYLMVGRYADVGDHPDTAVLLIVTGNLVVTAALMLSQAMESVTRAFYSRGDLDLILTSPASARRLFAMRIAAMAFSVQSMALLLAAPFINVLALSGGAHWLGGYAVVIATGFAATALAVALTVWLFRLIGPRRTRLIAQIAAAVIGAAFVIGLQIAAIMAHGTLSRLMFLTSETMRAVAPAENSLLWWPAQAVMGDGMALLVVCAVGTALLAATIAVFAPQFGAIVLATGSANHGTVRAARRTPFRRASPMQALRRKEWALLRRDPWLISQTLMQILYLLPPALLLWRSFADGTEAMALLVPVLVMASGQLSGGLAWLAISGEDAPDLIASAPVSPRDVLRAKIQAVLGAVALVFAPLVLALAVLAPFAGLVGAAFIGIAAASATAIQFWFRGQAKRSQFRRRQISSRVATIGEALTSVGWAGTSAIAAMGDWRAIVPAAIVLVVLAVVRWLSPSRA